jgi:hypothetical protein
MIMVSIASSPTASGQPGSKAGFQFMNASRRRSRILCRKPVFEGLTEL